MDRSSNGIGDWDPVDEHERLFRRRTAQTVIDERAKRTVREQVHAGDALQRIGDRTPAVLVDARATTDVGFIAASAGSERRSLVPTLPISCSVPLTGALAVGEGEGDGEGLGLTSAARAAPCGNASANATPSVA